MKTKRKSLIILALIIVGIGMYFGIHNKNYKIDAHKISLSSVIEYSSEFNYRQSINDCGPFNVAAVVRALTKNPVDSQEFSQNIQWRLPNKYTLPWGMKKQLKENDIHVETPNIKKLSDENKVLFLQEQLSLKKPVIILGERENYEHYITLFGFDISQNEFYAYDSLFTKGENGFTTDENGTFPGNRNFTVEELLNFWRGGGMYGFYNWYSIVASKL